MSRMRRLRLLSSFTVLLVLPSLSAETHQPAAGDSPRKIAFVVGNDSYSASPLKNGVNDARAMAAALESIGFHVTKHENVGRVSMERGVDAFASLIQPGDLALFFYAGHGIEIDGENYLLPVDFRAQDAVDAKYEAYAARRVLEKMHARGARVRIALLDACRNNPFAGRSAGGGLGRMNAVEGEFIAFATAPKRTASDNGAETNGLFTKHLVRALLKPDLRIQDVFKQTQQAVHAASNGTQVPYAEDGVIGDLYLTGGARGRDIVLARPAAAEPDTNQQAEVAFWQSVERDNTPEMYALYLSRYPRGQFAEIALARRSAPMPKVETTSASPSAAAEPPENVLETLRNMSPINKALGMGAGYQSKYFGTIAATTLGIKMQLPDYDFFAPWSTVKKISSRRAMGFGWRTLDIETVDGKKHTFGNSVGASSDVERFAKKTTELLATHK